MHVFSGFRRNLARTKTQESTDKVSEHNGPTVFSRVSTGGLHFVFNHLTLFILIPHYLHQLPFLTLPFPLTEYADLPAQLVIRKSKTASPLTIDKSLSATDPLRRPPHFQRRICHWAYHCLWLRPPFPPILAIHFHCRRRNWWLPPIAAYLISPMLISFNISVPPPVSLRDAPPIFPESWVVPFPIPTRRQRRRQKWRQLFGSIIGGRSIGMPSPHHFFLSRLPHMFPGNIAHLPGPPCLCWYWHRWTRTRRRIISPLVWLDNPGKDVEQDFGVSDRSCCGLLTPKPEQYFRIQIIRHRRC